DSTQSRIPRLDAVGSRIPVPGSFRIPTSAVRLPSKRGAIQPPPSTPNSLLRPPSLVRSGAITIARSYSGDKLSNGEPSPFPLLAASTPAPAQLRFGLTTPQKSSGLPFHKKLELVASGTTERLEDIKLCRREFAIPSDDDEDGAMDCCPDASVQMLVDESLELVGANSTDNLLDPPVTTELPCGEENATIIIANKHAPVYVRNEHTVTLQRDGNVTYEVRRSGTFVRSSRESLNSPHDRPRPPVLSQTHTRSHTSLSTCGVVLGLTKTFRRDSTESIASPVLDVTRTMPFRRPSTGELLLEEEGLRRPPILNSTMVNERLLNVTQSIPNITQELLYADTGREPCLVPGDSVLNRTNSVEGQKAQRELGSGSKANPNRLTFNLEESLNLMQFSAVGSTGKHGPAQVFSSTFHSDSMAIPASGSAGSVQMKQLAVSQHSTTMLMDISAQDRTLVPSELEQNRLSDDEEPSSKYPLGRRNIDQRETSLEADVSAGKEIFDLSLEEPEPCDEDADQQHLSYPQQQQEVVLRRHLENRSNTVPAPKQRYSFGLDLTECTLDCSIELCDSSLSLSKPVPHLKSPTSSLTKQGSFEMDESLGILTPDQMKEFLDSTTTNTNTNNTNNAANAAGLELHLNTGIGAVAGGGPGHHHHKHGALQHHCRIDQTPSPEELPLDPVGVKTDMSDIMLPAELLLIAGGPQSYGGGGGGVGSGTTSGSGATVGASELSQADSDPKTDQMTKSATSSKVSNSFITSITSITSLDTGYQGDGEMSRPASRGADHSPSNGPRVKSAIGGGAWQPMMAAAVAAVPRRQDPMTDSDFFTESDADDVFNRGDARRAQIIDGQLYGAPGGAGGPQGANAIFNAIDEQDDPDLQQQHHHQQQRQDAGQNEDSCMESSGIFTDVENRADDDLVQRRADDQQEAAAAVAGNNGRGFGGEQLTASDDMSPDLSTDTMSSSNSQNFVRAAEHARVDELNETCKLAHDERELDVADDGTPSLSPHIGASPKASEQHHHYHQTDGVDIGTVECPTAGTGSPGSSGGSGGVVVVVAATGNVTRRSDADSFHDVSGKRSAACSNSANSAGSSNGGSASRKQLKNEANRGLRKHHQHATAVVEMQSTATSSIASRTDRLSKARLFKDSQESSRAGGVSVECNGSESGIVGGGDCCDQENKRPSVGGVVGTRTGGVSARGGGSNGSNNLSFVKKSNTPNKWDAVMSKIAENKSVMRRNFSDVKSRISCGSGAVVSAGASKGASSTLVRRDSPATAPGSLKSPPSECTSVASRSSAHGKRTISGSVKRKNSQARAN
uniref:Uncharacterized protein n=1 Tax=Anopheles christyi TaxID=43041 RepID=A0A182KCA4_9DIPT